MLGKDNSEETMKFGPTGTVYGFEKSPVDTLLSPPSNDEINRVVTKNTRYLGRSNSLTTPLVAEYPLDKDFGFHKDTDGANIYFSYNDEGTIKYIELTNTGGSGSGSALASFTLFASNQTVLVGDGTQALAIGAAYNGRLLTAALATVHTQGVTGTTDIRVRRRRAGTDVDMLSTPITVGAEYFAADGVIDAANDDIATGDQIYIDVDAVHTTAPIGLSVVLTFT